MRAMTCVLSFLGPCNGRLTQHHCVPRQRLRRAFPYGANLNQLTGPKYVPVDRRDLSISGRDVPLRDILKDERNLLPLCFHHHMAWEQRAVRLGRGLIPLVVEDFAADFGMEWSLDRDYGPRTTTCGGSRLARPPLAIKPCVNPGESTSGTPAAAQDLRESG